jgi:hypothetical protein
MNKQPQIVNNHSTSPILWHDPSWEPNKAAAICDAREKERLIVQTLRNFIDNDKENAVAVVAGIRHVGKTAALKQLWAGYPGAVYIDLSAEGINYVTIETHFLNNPSGLLLLDEITYMDDYEMYAQTIYDKATSCGFKVIITGSSSAHTIKLSISKLGGGRCVLFRLPPVTFVEYLYFTDRIPNYNAYQTATPLDFADYLLLKDLKVLRVQFDGDYFKTFYSEIAEGNRRRYLSDSLVDLHEDDLTHLANLIAYKLGEAVNYAKVLGDRLNIGAKERSSLVGLNDKTVKPKQLYEIYLSDAFITESKDAAKDITAQDKGRILHFMLWAGLALIERTKTGPTDKMQSINDILTSLRSCKKTSELEKIFNAASICVSTPLFYTRLGADIVSRLGVDVEYMCRGALLGHMLELYIRGAVAACSSDRILSSVKLNYAVDEGEGFGEVDIYSAEQGLLIESTHRNKPETEIHVQNYMKEQKLIRICTTDKQYMFTGQFHRLSYPVLCCMIDTGDVFDLEKTSYSFKK